MSSSIARFTFSPFAENTYVVADASGLCAIIDPGCSDAAERKILKDYIEQHKLKPVHLLNTHCHIDHVFGNRFVSETWNLKLEAHRDEQLVLDSAVLISKAYGVAYEPSPSISVFLEPGSLIEFGQVKLSILFTPGHSPASVAFYHADEGYVLCGDTLFEGSIGRTDLPGGDTETLMKSIERELLSLPPSTRLLPGHMEETTVQRESQSNPFILAWKKGMPLN